MAPFGLTAVALGRLGGLKGGKARAAILTSEQTREIAKMAAKSRWKPNKNHKTKQRAKNFCFLVAHCSGWLIMPI
ncbi:MAG TPA: hypothetical protein VNX46_10825 [Candidatus Acidoferrum sp.]|jgi:hypothetical protein|nr:hypothetical protein [Candidatus Acidoferrum sp.]